MEVNRMDDLISRQAAIDTIAEFLYYPNNWDGMRAGFDLSDWRWKIESILSELPSAQPEIIRCKDCRNNHWCNIQEAAMAGDNFFCGAAERRTDEA